MAGPHPDPVPRTDSPHATPLRIVVADDDPFVLKFYQVVFSSCGHEVFPAVSGRQAADLCRKVRPDVFLTSRRLPDRDGLEVAAEVGRGRRLPAVVVSGRPPGGAAWDGPGSPVVAYLIKPVSSTVLRAAVEVAAKGFERVKAIREDVAHLRRAAGGIAAANPTHGAWN